MMLVTTVTETMMENTTDAPSSGLSRQEKLLKASELCQPDCLGDHHVLHGLCY